MTKEEAQKYKARWELINEFTIDEARRASASFKLQQMAFLDEAGRTLGWSDMSKSEEEVRERWRHLREKFHA
jgi:hypothetical protein